MVTYENFENQPVDSSVDKAIIDIRTITGNSADLNIMEVEISQVRCAVVTIEGMLATLSISQEMFSHLMRFDSSDGDSEKVFDFLTRQSLLSTERRTVFNYGELMRMVYSGFGAVLVDGMDKAVMFGVQGYDKRSVSEPSNEINVKGAHDGFIEVVRSNMSLVRRRMKTPSLRFEMLQVGEKSKTDVCIAYVAGRAKQKYIDEVRKKLSGIKLDTVLTSGYISAFLEQSDNGRKSIFSKVYTTERPDVFCAKLNEGRVGIIIDGTPFALMCPTFFSENFITMDDYVSKPFYAAYIRILKYICFFLTIAMPGVYVALATYHPETFSHKLLLNLAASEEATPYPLYVEVFIMMIFYEIMREAGIRLPREVGGAVSIVGGLIIGDAAVKSGLVSGAILIVIGITATASFVVPSINEQTTILRLVFILAGGISGLFGIGLAASVVIINVCAMENYGVPYSAPFTPFTPKAFFHAFARGGFKGFAKDKSTVYQLKGTE